ncbi:hypothetical protein [Sporolactobacillus pectinivorans]|uniref:hypothetical protein n=1 Tax=Sporolactobacillus pectinivorans TaxID=1591408 RepID=UPI000C26BFC1|nr:hypothetical protein [Sporolactobacillus pectinivorans]
MAKPVNLDEIKIPKVDLEHYRFSPPGSMGWSAAEYDQLLNHPEIGIQTETFSPPEVPDTSLTELSLSSEHLVSGEMTEKPEKVHSSIDVDDEIPKEKTEVKKEKTKGIHEEKTESEKIKVPDPTYVVSENPPAKPWIAKKFNLFYS